MGWYLARIRNRKTNFVYVKFDKYNSDYDEIVEIERIRPVNTRPSLHPSTFQRKEVEINIELLEWSNGEEVDSELEKLREQSKVLNISFYDEKREKIVILGSDDSIVLAAMLLDVTMKHHLKIIKMQRDKEAMEEKRKEEIIVSFPVKSKLMGCIIGKEVRNFN